MSAGSWNTEEILITVRAAPNPSKKYTETSCVAGVRLSDMKPIRIYPVPARQLSMENRFRKYSVISADIQKSTDDPRHESYKINFDTIQTVRQFDTGPGRPPTWGRRSELVQPFRCASSIEQLWAMQENLGVSEAPSLALIRPTRITKFTIEDRKEKDWSPRQLAILHQLGMFDRPQTSPLDFIPYRFKYDFECDDVECKGHSLTVLDWEITESYRSWRRRYGENGWKDAMRTKYWSQLVEQKDLQFYLGTMKSHMKTWTIVGLYYPPRMLEMPTLNI